MKNKKIALIVLNLLFFSQMKASSGQQPVPLSDSDVKFLKVGGLCILGLVGFTYGFIKYCNYKDDEESKKRVDSWLKANNLKTAEETIQENKLIKEETRLRNQKSACTDFETSVLLTLLDNIFCEKDSDSIPLQLKDKKEKYRAIVGEKAYQQFVAENKKRLLGISNFNIAKKRLTA